MNQATRISQLAMDAKSRIREVTHSQAHEEQAQGSVLIEASYKSYLD